MPDDNTVHLPAQATVGRTEAILAQYFLEKGRYPTTMTLDFSACRFVEVTTLMFVIPLLSDRISRELETHIRLPRFKAVRDFMRVWNFPEAVARATGRPFSSLVCQDDLRYFGENRSPSQQKYTPKFRDPSVTCLVYQSFFGIVSFSPAQLSRTRLVTEESKRWEGQLIRSVLSKHLDGPDGYMASRIVYESMTNAARHPRATVIQTGSKFSAPREQKDDARGHFTISFWDDGRSMIDTLFSAIEEGRPVRSKETPDLYREYRVVLKDHTGRKESEYVVSSAEAPDADSEEYEVLFSVTFPGVTSDIEGKGHKVHENLRKENPDLSVPGMGLYVLLNAAIDVFGGSVAFRTKNYFMNVRTAARRDPTAYRAKIQRFDEDALPVFKGNLVTVRLPLKKRGV